MTVVVLGRHIRFGADAIPFGAVVLVIGAVLLLGMRQSFTVPGALGLSPASLIFFGCGLLWVLTRIVGQRSRAGLGILSGAVVLYAVASLVSFGSLASRPTDPAIVLGSQTNLITEFALVTVFFFIVAVIRTRTGIEWVAKGLVIGGAISATFGIVQYGTGIDLAAMLKPPLLNDHGSVLSEALMREGFARPQGSAGHPLELSAVLTVLVPVALGVVYSARAQGRRSWHWVLLTVVLVGGAALTLSRSAVVGLAVAVLFMAWKWPVRRVLAIVAVVGVPLVVAYVTDSKLLNAFVQIFATSGTDSSLQSRDHGRDYVLQHFADHLWFGEGTATYSARGYPVLDNQYLGRLMETGLFGVASFVLLLGAAFFFALIASQRFWRRAQASQDRRDDAGMFELTRGIAAAIAAVGVIALILDVSGFAQIWLLMWILVGLAGSSYYVARSSIEAPVSERVSEQPSTEVPEPQAVR
ncbi:O-antigen ligase family protein [Rhodococcoides kyotonense]|uniref:O-Antigen ligase n=1 Tax=Rhodococcoides kyotonense TaxID=398843 RepID=A0A239LMI8_9NOCA|nr:O-antigen ligase family protein [Rhodococcus kyotonensis]SNT31033.1 O-Antigen ligase [Rhodococcus kyotonensis]